MPTLPSPTLFLVRGHPGSGKTTHAQALQAQHPGLIHIENDQLFVDDQGHYTFDLSRHQEAKDTCLARTRVALEAGQSVVVSNTFTTRAELAPYLALAHTTGHACRVIEMHGQFPNVHAVPAGVVEAKKAAFEPHEGAEVVTFDTPDTRRRPRLG